MQINRCEDAKIDKNKVSLISEANFLNLSFLLIFFVQKLIHFFL